MSESEEFILPLDNLFFDRPVVHKVKPLCQDQNVWQPDAASVISEISVAQDIQKEAKYLFSTGFSQKARTFLPPFRQPNVCSGKCIRNLADKEGGQKAFGAWAPDSSSDRFHTADSNNQVYPSTLENLDHLVETRSFHSRSSPRFQTRLFKAPLTSSVSNCVSVPTKPNHSLSHVAIATEHPPTMLAVATCGPFKELGQIKKCSPSQQKCDSGLEKTQLLPITPKPVQIQGLSCPGILRSVSEIPAKFRSVFRDFPYFNYVQSKALDDVLYTSKNFVACAPTGSGKTVLFELAIIRLLMETTEPWHNVRAVYMAPIKALCNQQYENWKQKFGPLGLNCKELTGDTEIDDFFEIQDAHLIMTTPEKWDSMTRKWRDNCLLHSVRLFLIDEVHVVKDLTRGATLEVVVSRMKAIHSYRMAENPDSKTNTRFIAVSATIPNFCDIADWLSDDLGLATCLEMDESHRPVKLRKVVLGFPSINNQNEFKFDLSLNYKMASIIQTYSDQKPTLVFCSTRKGVQQSAAVLAKDARFIMSSDHKQRLKKYANSLFDSKLRDLIICGVGYHHAGVSASDRKVVEDAFTVGDLPVLFTTSTLAMGVNLPAHLVVIKSTMHYVGGSCEEYSEADLLQMIGRAGRPQFDTSATAVIMTRSQTKDKYMQFLNGSETIESSLHTNLVEHLNAEICLHTISDVNMALDWIRSTFLYIRALKNPKHYGFSPDLDKCGIETKLQELCLKNLNSLASFHLIAMDEDINIKPTESGKLMARYYVAFDTMKQFSKVTGRESLSELIEMISQGKEFNDVQLRVSEKRTLNTLNKDKNRVTIRYPMDGKIKTNNMKVNCLIQAQLGCIPVQEFGLTQDTGKIFRNGIRVSKCLAEFLSHHPQKNFSAQLNSLILAKCFRAKLWENSPYVSKQLDKIGLSLATAMVNAGLTSFNKIEATNARELELIMNRHPPFGNQIKEAVSKLPKYEVSMEQLPRYSACTAEIVVMVNLKNFEQLMTKRTAPDHHYVTVIMGDCDNNVVFLQKIPDAMLLKSGSWSRKTEVARTPKGDEISIHLISSEFVGLDIQQKFSAFYSKAKVSSESLGVGSIAYVPQSEQETSHRHTSTVLNYHRVIPRAQVAAQKVQYSPEDQDHTQTEIGKRQCNHFCKNKELCGHDCCKVGVQVGIKRPNQESIFSSYLKDLKIRNEKLIDTPVKRLKMRMNNKADSISMKQFSYKPKDTIPAHTSVNHKMEVGQGFATPQDLAYFESDHDDVFIRRETTERPMSRIPASHKRTHAIISQPNLSTDSDSVPDALNVTFDLAGDDWDDFDDDNLVLACEVSCKEDWNDCSKSTDCQSSVLSTETEPKSGLSAGIVPAATASQRCTCPEISAASVKHPLQKQHEAKNVSLQRRFNFFLKEDSAKEEHKGLARDQMEEKSEVDVFLGIFEGIF
ncbi:probable ATP-dependent DNA helicase HFM1 [Electrophorus electricus]|uniref:probable ATP-dependent DNA helicase HFM1 n=1 Tax=Electrophorus electricus TaxID=8005 RepID=UPI0015D03BDC|nr:probable ATP-dependent DNA helicase HFM1 [Electrophorus electricus]